MPFHPHFTDFPWMRTDLRGARAPLRNLRGGWGRELSRNRHEGVLSAAPVLYLQILVCPKGAEAWETQRQNIELKYRQNNGIISLSKGTQANCNLAWLCMGLKFVSANHIGIQQKKKKKQEPRPQLASELDPGNLYNYLLCVIYENDASPLLSAGHKH